MSAKQCCHPAIPETGQFGNGHTFPRFPHPLQGGGKTAGTINGGGFVLLAKRTQLQE